jgi:hypothetical protein
MPTIEHTNIARASLQCAVWAHQCQAIVNNLTARDPNTTGFHRRAVGAIAMKAWDAYVNVTRAHDPEEHERLLDDASDAAESAANLLMAYSNTLTRPDNHPDNVS